MNYYPFHIGDYISATRHLSWEEDAAYRRLLDIYYTSEKPLPLDLRAVCRLVLATTDSQREAVDVVLGEFFESTPDGWINRRADTEILAMREKQQKQRDRANKRWQKQDGAHGNADGNAPAMPRHEDGDAVASISDADAMPPTPTPTPTPTPKKNTPLPPKGGCRRFEEFWTAWPKSERKQDKVKCAEKWRRSGLDEQADRILADVAVKQQTEKWREGYIEAPLVYLNGKRWEDGVEPAGQAENLWAGAT